MKELTAAGQVLHGKSNAFAEKAPLAAAAAVSPTWAKKGWGQGFLSAHPKTHQAVGRQVGAFVEAFFSSCLSIAFHLLPVLIPELRFSRANTRLR